MRNPRARSIRPTASFTFLGMGPGYDWHQSSTTSRFSLIPASGCPAPACNSRPMRARSFFDLLQQNRPAMPGARDPFRGTGKPGMLFPHARQHLCPFAR